MTLEEYKATYPKKIKSLTEACTTAYNDIKSRGTYPVNDNNQRMTLDELIEDEILVHFKLDTKSLKNKE